MNKQSFDDATRWIYRGVWAVLVRWFRVPEQPPNLPVAPGERLESFRPAPGFLRYLKLQFWIGISLINIALMTVWIVIAVLLPLVGGLLAPLLLVFIILPNVVAYIAIHLRFDTTWYVMTERSLRIRRGIWVLHETTITFENVQNVVVNQGPVQRYFGIANVVVETAGGGGGGGGPHGQHHGTSGAHQGLLEGVSNAEEIRDLILRRLRRSTTSGLGDEAAVESPHTWLPEHVFVLREIRSLLQTSQ